MEKIANLWDHQEKTFDRAKDMADYALFFEQGAGKTLTAITLWRYKCYHHKKFLRTLVVAPPITLENWKAEYLKFSKIKEDRLCVLFGSQKKRVKAFTKFMEAPGGVIITNYEALSMTELMVLIENWGVQVLIYDESHKLKDPKSNRSKASHELSKPTLYRWILTGTPILNTAMDIWSQYMALDMGETFGDNFFQFRGSYFYDANAHIPRRAGVFIPQKWLPRPDTYAELNAKIYKKATRVLKKDCMDLPPLVKQILPVEMSSKQATAYKKMERDFIAYINDKACVAEMALTKGLRLQQIVSGFVRFDDGSVEPFKDDPRAKALTDLLETITVNHKVLVWAVFKENYKAIRKVCDKLKIKYVEVHGGIKDKFAAVDQFNNDEDTRVFIGHPLSAGIGINLVSASYSIFYSRGFSLEADLQAEARNYRGGSETHERITRIDLVAPETIDELIAERLADKQGISDSVLKEIAHEKLKKM